jgi:hypothetical protein
MKWINGIGFHVCLAMDAVRLEYLGIMTLWGNESGSCVSIPNFQLVVYKFC